MTSFTPATPAVPVAQFRLDLPEFADPSVYPTSTIQFWLNLAAALTNNRQRWGVDLIVTGQEMFTAHNIVLEALNNGTVQVGGIPGLNKGAIQAEGAKGVTVNYDTLASTLPGAGHWNLTTYGTRFKYLVSIVGMGPLQIGAGPLPCNPLSSANAWGGPDCAPGWLG